MSYSAREMWKMKYRAARVAVLDIHWVDSISLLRDLGFESSVAHAVYWGKSNHIPGGYCWCNHKRNSRFRRLRMVHIRSHFLSGPKLSLETEW